MTKFLFWEPVLVHNHITSYPSTADKILVRFIGFGDTVGNAGCYKVYNPETGQVLYRSLLVCSLEASHHHEHYVVLMGLQKKHLLSLQPIFR